MMRVYLAGPMTGIEDYNFPAFHEAAKRLRDIGYEVSNPAENFEGDQSLPWDVYLRRAIEQVVTVDGVAVLPGWSRSKGARLEVHVADALGMPILDAETLAPVSRDILAALLVTDVVPRNIW